MYMNLCLRSHLTIEHQNGTGSVQQILFTHAFPRRHPHIIAVPVYELHKLVRLLYCIGYRHRTG